MFRAMPKPRGTPALYVGLSGDAPRTPPARIALGDVTSVELHRAEVRRLDRKGGDVILSLADPRMSTQHARLSRSGDGDWVIADLGSKNGTWVGSERVMRQPLADRDVMLVGHTAFVYRDTGGEAGDLVDGEVAEIVAEHPTISAAFAEQLRALAQAAAGAAPIVFTGEPGSGKERLARAAHALSKREGSFVAASCGGLAPDCGEIVRSAHRGTLLLDDVVELQDATQQALVRALADKELDVRLMAATHRELDDEVAANRFRADLRARLAGCAITLPPLRHRREDLALLVRQLLARLAPERAITFSSDAVTALYGHDWPLNVRELERSLAAALATATSDRIELSHLPVAVGSTEPMEEKTAYRAMTPEERALRDNLVAAIARNEGNLAGVAREMGKDRTQIRRWMKKFGITRDVKD